jgi:hypothetical protein
VDLAEFTAGFINPIFTVSNAANGTIAMAGDGHTVQFTPRPNFVGFGSFQFSVPYPDGAIATFTVGVCISTVH